jgi:hypothetical protein
MQKLGNRVLLKEVEKYKKGWEKEVQTAGKDLPPEKV